MKILAYEIEKNGVHLLLNVSPRVPEEIYSDQNRLKQILFNLIGNAKKFTHTGKAYFV